MSASDPEPAVYDHLRPTAEAPVARGVYRVVGAADEGVTLLRVGDADGRRVNTGEVVTVDRTALAAFDAADNPDGNRPTGEAVRGFLDDFAWRLRAFAGGLRARPVAAAAGLALAVVGHQGHRVLPVPEAWLTVAYLAGVFAVVYVGARGG